jgi:glycerol uptake facilitator protein
VPYSLLTALIAEIAGTMVLLLGIVGWGDSNKGGGWAGGLIVGFIVCSVGLSLGGPSGYAINPARDFGPRLLGLVVGTQNLFGADFYWLVAPIIGPLIGGPLGIVLYDVFIKPGLPTKA